MSCTARAPPPLFNLFARLRGLKRYRRYISRDLEPFYRDSELAVLGLNTARSLALKSGRINQRQIDCARKRLCGLEASVTKMIVTHHPFEMPVGKGPSVGRARIALNRLSECRVDLFLAGHFHVSSAAPTTFNVPANGYSSLIIQAGTALSTRTRSEHNSFNVIRVELPELSVERVNWNPEAPAFTVAATERSSENQTVGRVSAKFTARRGAVSSSHKR